MRNIKSQLNECLFRALRNKDLALIACAIKAQANVDIQYLLNDRVYCIAVETNNTDIVKQLIKAGGRVDVKDKSGDLVLFRAMWSTHLHIERELKMYGVKVDIRFDYEWNAKELAVYNRTVQNDNIDIHVVKHLVKAGADVNAKDDDGDPVLVLAVGTKNIGIIKELVKAEADVNAEDQNGDPVLVSAIEIENIDIVKELVMAGANVNAKDGDGDPVLVLAVEIKNIEIVKELVKARADVSAEDQYGYPVLASAVRTENIDIVKELVKTGANAEDGVKNHLVLLSAVETENIDIVKVLVKAGADVNAVDHYKHPVLVSAVETKNIDIVKELMEAGADVNVKDQDGNPVLVSAVRTEDIYIVKELVKAGADVNANDRFRNPVLVSAMRTKNIDIVKELVNLKAGANVDAKDRNGNPVLVTAVMTKNIDIVKELVKAKANVNVRKHTDRSIVRPIHVAVAHPDGEIFQELLKSGAYINYDNQGEVSPLHLVSVETNEDILRQVYNDEKNRNARGIYNRTFLHTAASLGSHQQIEVVLSLSNSSVDLKDDFGNSPLHCAVQIGNLETIRALITAGCDTEAVDSSGRTMLHLAAIYGHSDLVKLFIDEYGLDPLKLDNMQRNCLHYAVIFRRENFVRALLQRNVNSLEEYNINDSSGRRPSGYLHSCEMNSLISKYLQGESVEIQIVPLRQIYSPGISNALNLSNISKEPRIGSVATITGHDNRLFVIYVKHLVEVVIQEALPTAQGRVVGCGSSFGGTKTGMPDEFDFLVKLDSMFSNEHEHEGYGTMERDPVTGSYGLWLWNILMSFWSDCQTKGETVYSDGKRSMKMPLPPQRHPDRKTCTTWIWLYSDEMFTDLPVSIDFVPAVEVGLERAGTRPMTVEKKCYFVPKIPNEKSKVKEKFKNQNLHQLGRVSYPTLEVEHIKALEDRVKDVYITAKCVRYVEVCGFKVENDEGDTKSVSELVTSYRLKSVFLHLVELFRKSDMSLGKMVLMVYEQLEKCLERGHLPMFFEPEINVLAGSKLSTEESLQATTIVTRFVRSLYERDYSPEQRARDAAEEKRVLEEERVAHGEKWRKYRKERDDLFARRNENKVRKLLAPFLPIYLKQPSSNTEQE